LMGAGEVEGRERARWGGKKVEWDEGRGRVCMILLARRGSVACSVKETVCMSENLGQIS